MLCKLTRAMIPTVRRSFCHVLLTIQTMTIYIHQWDTQHMHSLVVRQWRLHSDRWVGPAHALVPSHPWLKPGTSVGEANYYLAQGIQYCNSVSDVLFVSYNVFCMCSISMYCTLHTQSISHDLRWTPPDVSPPPCPPDRTSTAPWAGEGVVSLQGGLRPVVSSVCDELNQEPSGQRRS